jgi:hypothetical protein
VTISSHSPALLIETILRTQLADSPLMRIGDYPALVPESEPDPEPTAASPCDSESIWATVRRVLGEVLNHGNARLTAECIALVSCLGYDGATMTEIAKRHGITRAAVSKRCVELTELLDLRPSRAMRSLTSRTASRSARIQTTRSYETTDPTA